MPGPRTLDASEARRLAVAATGLDAPPPPPDVAAADATAAGVTRVVRRLGILQVDSVNVLARAHHLTLIARLGADPGAGLRAAASGRRRTLFEYWGREASLLPVEHWPLWQWRMADARAGVSLYPGLRRFRAERAGFVDAVLGEVRRGGPTTARELSPGGGARASWWGWSDAKRALEWLFWAGLVTAAGRRGTFERVYDLPERALPRRVLDAPVPPRGEAQRRLLRVALRARGVATDSDLRDALRLSPADLRERVRELAEAGDLRPARLPGGEAAWTLRGARVPPAPAEPRAVLVNPFDPLLACRDRVQRLFGLRHRIEIYVPREERVLGYYVLPLLMGDRLVARVDLKADRPAGVLRVLAAHLDAGDPDEVAEALAGALLRLAAVLGLGGVATGDRGDLAGVLHAALGLVG